MKYVFLWWSGQIRVQHKSYRENHIIIENYTDEKPDEWVKSSYGKEM